MTRAPSMVIRLLVLLLVAVSPGCKSRPKVCDAEGLEKIEAALREVSPAQRAEMASMGLVEACGGGEQPLPSGLRTALETVYQAPPEFRTAGMMRGVASESGLLGQVCKGGPGAVAAMGEVAPDEKLDTLWKGCGLGDDAGFATRGELNLQPPEQTLVALMLHRWLKDGGVDGDRAKKLARAVAGL